MKRLKHRKIWAAALSLSLLAVSCGGGGGSSASSSQSQSVSSQAEETPLDGGALLDEIYQDLELMGILELDETVMAD